MDHYSNSSVGWSTRNKTAEMKEDDLKYIVVWSDTTVAAFMSFMPTVEDGHAVLYCYEIHLHTFIRG
jgi:hypothetical protein